MVKSDSAWLAKKRLVVTVLGGFFLALVYASQTYSNNTRDTLVIVRGESYSNRVVMGVARIVKSAADCQAVQMGDIVVAVMTCEQWLPALERCSAIITDLGGDYCHALLYGKKRGIPVIVGAGNATQKINDGDYIKLDCAERSYGCVYFAENQSLLVQPAAHSYSSSGAAVYQSAIYEQRNASYQTSHHQFYTGSEEKVMENKEVRQLSITHDVFNRHYTRYVADVLSTKNKLWWGKRFNAVERGAAGQGFDPFSIKCIPIADDFFELSEKEIRSITQVLPVQYLNYINVLIERCKSRSCDKNWIARVSHEEHIRTITLSGDIKREELIEDPLKYKTIIDQKKVDTKERHMLIAAGLFARYWYENNCQV